MKAPQAGLLFRHWMPYLLQERLVPLHVFQNAARLHGSSRVLNVFFRYHGL